jgi:hypothetical protein
MGLVTNLDACLELDRHRADQSVILKRTEGLAAALRITQASEPPAVRREGAFLRRGGVGVGVELIRLQHQIAIDLQITWFQWSCVHGQRFCP